MEEDIEKALNNLWNSLDDEFFNLTYSQEQMQEDIRLILNRYNYLDSTYENLINKYKELEKERESIYADYQDLGKEKLKLEEKCEELKKNYKKLLEYVHYLEEIRADQTYENEEQEKVIELMAEAFKQDDIRSEEEIIEHFRKKAKGE